MSVPRGRLKPLIQSSFKLHGFQLRVDACKHLESLLTALDSLDECQQWVDKILDVLASKDGLGSAMVDKALLSKVIEECSQAEAGEDNENVFNVINTFQVPRFHYSKDRKKYLPDQATVPCSVYADADKKADVFRLRYETIHQRTSRQSCFPRKSMPVEAAVRMEVRARKKYQLKNVDYLLGTTTKLTDVIVLGMLTQIKHGRYSLEDPSGVMDLELSEAKFHRGLYTENCFVLVEGWYEDLVFHVTAMGHPPAESAQTSRSYTGSINFFGGPLEASAKSNADLLRIEQSGSDDGTLVILSDVWLDKPSVMSKLAKLFAGYAAIPPTAFIFMGNFTSEVHPGGAATHSRSLQDHFRALGEVMAEHPDLVQKSKFVFVPGNADPTGFPNIYPRPPLPQFLVQEMIKKLPNGSENILLATNPGRIQYCTQEIVLFREDIVSKMCRNCIYFPESGDIPSHFGRTLVSQSHLSPLPLHVCPVYWDFDRSMWLYPLPDLVVCADKFDPFVTEHSGCTIVNPGSFAKNDFSFKTYMLKTKQIEDSQIPDDE